LARRAWQLALEGDGYDIPADVLVTPVEFREIANPLSGEARTESNLSTNQAAQWGLNVIACLELIGDELPENLGQVDHSEQSKGV
jgi:hypothetical protein